MNESRSHNKIDICRLVPALVILMLSLFLFVPCIPVRAESAITITFDANGGTGSMDEETAAAGKKVSLPASTFSRCGYIFRGWVTSPDSDHREIADQAETSFDESVTLYAFWEPQLYIVKFDGNGIVNSNMTEMYAYYGTPTALTDNKFYKEDYWFRGWIDSRSGRRYADGQTILNLRTGDTLSYKVRTVDNGLPENTDYTFRSTQGSCVYTKDGVTYLVSISIINDSAYNSGDLSHYENIIVKYDLGTGDVVASKRGLAFDHGNSVCYNPDNDHLYVAEGGSKEGYPSGVMELDSDLNEVQEFNFPLLNHIWAISYCDGYYYVIGRGSGSRNSFCVLNSEMKTLSITAVDDYYENYSSQGIEADDTFIYAISVGFKDYDWKNKQRISVFTHEGEYLGVFSIDLSDEIEDISLDGEYLYLTTNEHSAATVYRTRIPSVTLTAVWER